MSSAPSTRSAPPRRETQSVIHQNYGCGAGHSVCSISVSGEVNHCSFLGPGFVAANVREQSLAEIWHRSQTFREIRALAIQEPSSSTGETATFSSGCRARVLVLNGSVDAPDPWITPQADQERSRLPSEPVYNPLRMLEVPERRCGCG